MNVSDPPFPGLSYSTFAVANASASKVTYGSLTALPEDLPVAPGGNPALWETVYKVTASVTNTGDVAGYTVAQLYLGLPQIAGEATTPVKALRGFEKVWLEPGEEKTVTFDLHRRDISYWDMYVSIQFNTLRYLLTTS